MTEIYAKPIIDNKFWIVEQDGNRIALLRKNESNRFILSNNNGSVQHGRREDFTKKYGRNFFLKSPKRKTTITVNNECYGFPTSCVPYNEVYDVVNQLPLFTKSEVSKSYHCAGYYIIKFNKGWVRSFCPKYITIERNEYHGPFKTEIEMRLELNNVKSD